MVSGKALWVKAIIAATIVVGVAGVFALSAYVGFREARGDLSAVVTRQARLSSQVELMGTEVSALSTAVFAGGHTLAEGTPGVPNTAPSDCPKPIHGRINSSDVDLFDTPFALSRIARLSKDEGVTVCGTTSMADWAKVRADEGIGWVQTNFIELPIGRSWADVPVVYP